MHLQDLGKARHVTTCLTFYSDATLFQVKTIFDITRRPDIEKEEAYQGIRFTSDLNDILHDESITLVTLCTPPQTHYDLAKRCLEHGKNVIVEKPFTRPQEKRSRYLRSPPKKG